MNRETKQGLKISAFFFTIGGFNLLVFAVLWAVGIKNQILEIALTLGIFGPTYIGLVILIINAGFAAYGAFDRLVSGKQS